MLVVVVVVSLSAALVVVVVVDDDGDDGGGGSGGGGEAGAETGMPKGVSSSLTFEEDATDPCCFRGDCTAARALFPRWGCEDRWVDEGTVRN